MCNFYAKQKSSAAALPFAGENPGYQIIALLLAEGAFLRPGEVFLGEFENDRRKQRHCNEVRNGHHTIEGFGDAPEEIELDGGTDNGNQGIASVHSRLQRTFLYSSFPKENSFPQIHLFLLDRIKELPSQSLLSKLFPAVPI